MPSVSKQASLVRRSHLKNAVDSAVTAAAKQRSHDTGCGFVQFCHKHIFSSPAAAVSPASARRKKFQQNSDTVLSTDGDGSFNSHFNPCYSNSSPPDDDVDDINLDAVRLYDSLCSHAGRKPRALPSVCEMSESCFEGLQSSSYNKTTDLSRQFRPLSWACPDDDLFDLGCSCSKNFTASTLKSEKCNQRARGFLNSSLESSEAMSTSLSSETPFYWELEKSGSQTSPLPEACQKVASPLRMGTLGFDVGNLLESDHAVKLRQHSAYTVDNTKAPKMGCLPSRCFVCRECQLICSVGGLDRARPVRVGQAAEVHLPRGCHCVKQRRCPTPPRMLSPSVDDDAIKVPVADI